METTSAASTTLASIAYDDTEEMLELEFCTRVVYQYFQVPLAVHQGLLSAASNGSYFNQSIRGRYRYVRLADRTDWAMCSAERQG